MLTIRDEKFIWIGGFETRGLPKAAGMRWDPTLKEWWTKDESRAVALIAHADDNAKERLGASVMAIKASTSSNTDIEIPVPDGLAYLPYQKAGIAYSMDRSGVLIGDEMGLGKTIQALGIANMTGLEAFPMIIVCPASLRLNWQREARKWLIQQNLSYCIIEGGKPCPEALVASVVIVNYDILPKHIDALCTREWGMVVCDEAHYLKSSKTQRSKSVLGFYDKKEKKKIPGLIQRARRKVFLTGTPISNRPAEIQPLAGALAPEEFGNFFQFAKRYCGGQQNGWGWDFSGASNLEELQRRLRATIMVRRLKADVLKELPAKRRQIIEISSSEAQSLSRKESEAWESRKEAVESAQTEADAMHAAGDEDGYKAAVGKMQAAFGAAFSEMAVIRRELAEAKAPKVVEHIRAMLEDGDVEKVVVFGHHKSVIRILCEGLSKFGVVSVTGETPMEGRQAAVDNFQNPDPKVRVFVGNIKAAGVGLTLTAASTVIFAELDWTPANMIQAEDRCHRIGQQESVLVQHLVFDGTLDAVMAKKLIAKQDVIDAAMDDDMTFIEPVMPVLSSRKADSRPKAYPPAKDSEKADCMSLLRVMSLLDSDRATAINGIGWNKIDGKFGHELAIRPSLSNGQVWFAKKMLRKYSKQIGSKAEFLRLFGEVA